MLHDVLFFDSSFLLRGCMYVCTSRIVFLTSWLFRLWLHLSCLKFTYSTITIYMHYYVTRIWSYKVSSITVACLSLGGYEQEFITDQPWGRAHAGRRRWCPPRRGQRKQEAAGRGHGRVAVTQCLVERFVSSSWWWFCCSLYISCGGFIVIIIIIILVSIITMSFLRFPLLQW